MKLVWEENQQGATKCHATDNLYYFIRGWISIPKRVDLIHLANCLSFRLEHLIATLLQLWIALDLVFLNMKEIVQWMTTCEHRHPGTFQLHIKSTVWKLIDVWATWRHYSLCYCWTVITIIERIDIFWQASQIYKGWPNSFFFKGGDWMHHLFISLPAGAVEWYRGLLLFNI